MFLNSATSYTIKIYPYTNDGVNVNYKTVAPASQTLNTTTASESVLARVTASPNACSLSTDDAADPAIESLVFTIKDDGTEEDADNAPTLITGLTFTPGTSNDALFSDWTTIISSVKISDGTSEIVGTIGATSIAFTLPADKNTNTDIGHIIDDATKTYTLQIWLTNPLPIGADTKGLEFELLNANVVNNAVDGSDIADGSGVAPAFVTLSSEPGNNIVDVTATEFDFVVSPGILEGVDIALSTPPLIEVKDAHENLDLNYFRNN